MKRRQHAGWTSQEIRALFDEIVEELSLLGECQHCEHMVDVTDDTELVIPLSDRISDRYTTAHIKHYSETTNEAFAEDLLPKTQ
jgi:hypothetical protein